MRFTLSRRISLFVGLLISIVLIGFGLIAIEFSANEITTSTEQTLLLTSKEGAKRISSTINLRLEILQEVANRDLVREGNLSQIRSALKQDVERLGYLDIAFVTPNGKANYIVENTSSDLSDREYVKQALSGKQAVSDVIISKVTGTTVLMYAVPIQSNGKIIGALVARRDGNSLTEVTDAMGVGQKGYAYMINDKGTVVAHPNREYVTNQFTPIEAAKDDASLKPLAQEIERILAQKEGVGSYTYNNIDLFSAFTPVEGSNWILVSTADSDEILSGLKHLRNILLSYIGFILIVGVLASILLGKAISKPILGISQDIKSIANYDLSIDNDQFKKYIKRKDEIGEIAVSLSSMKANLKVLVEKISSGSQHLAAASQEMTATSQQSATAANEVAKTIEEIATGASDQAQETQNGAVNVRQLGDYVNDNKEMLNRLNVILGGVNKLKDDGLETVDSLVEQNQVSQKAAQQVSEIITQTNVSSVKIETASQMIKSIANQTNLLALNAAIEAARAGDAGRGFAVVADEIRQLAEQSNKFTDEITQVINELINKSQEAVEVVKNVSEVTTQQTQSVNRTNIKFKGISGAIEKMKEQIEKIDDSSTKMVEKKEALVAVLENLSAISQQNAAGTQQASASVEEQTASMDEIASTSEDLAKLAQELQGVIEQFKI